MLFDKPEIPAETTAAVRELSRKGRLPQSVLLSGGDEKLREHCGRELAAAVLCDTPADGVPCGKCKSCKKIKAGSHPDLIIIEPEEGKKFVSKEVFSSIVTEKLYVAPNEAENKIYLFPQAQELSPIIQNALLKSIEEPPPFVMFIFLCDRRESMLETVISRCMELSLGDLQAETKKKEAALAAETAVALAHALCGGTEYDLMLATAPMQKNRSLMKKTAEFFTLIVRDAMAADSNATFLSGCEREAMQMHGIFDISALLRMKEAMEAVRGYADSNANENLLLSRFSASLWDAGRSDR